MEVNGVELLTMAVTIATAMGTVHIHTPIWSWAHDWWESQYIGPFIS